MSVGAAPGAAQGGDVRSVRKSVIFLVGVAIIYFVYLLASGQWGAFMEALAGVRMRWIVIALLCYVAYYLLGVVAYAIDEVYGRDD